MYIYSTDTSDQENWAQSPGRSELSKGIFN